MKHFNNNLYSVVVLDLMSIKEKTKTIIESNNIEECFFILEKQDKPAFISKRYYIEHDNSQNFHSNGYGYSNIMYNNKTMQLRKKCIIKNDMMIKLEKQFNM